MAFLIALLVLLSRRLPMSEVLTPRHLHDLGKFLLALVMVWAYFSFSQFLIIWAGNLPRDPWYLDRLRGGWQYVALALVIGHFALPFACCFRATSSAISSCWPRLRSSFCSCAWWTSTGWCAGLPQGRFGPELDGFCGADRNGWNLAGIFPHPISQTAADAAQRSALGRALEHGRE